MKALAPTTVPRMCRVSFCLRCRNNGVAATSGGRGNGNGPAQAAATSYGCRGLRTHDVGWPALIPIWAGVRKSSWQYFARLYRGADGVVCTKYIPADSCFVSSAAQGLPPQRHHEFVMGTAYSGRQLRSEKRTTVEAALFGRNSVFGAMTRSASAN